MVKVNRYDCSRKLLIITNLSCNLRCTYCYQHKDKDTVFNVDETLKQLIPALETKTAKGTIIKMLGGEPFLVFDKIKDMCERVWAMGLPENFLFHTTSNGTLVHGEIQTWLEKHKEEFTIKLSLDGNKALNDINRPGAFDMIDLDFFKRMWPDVGIKMTISPDSISHLFDSIVFFHEYGFATIKTNFAELVNWNQEGLFENFYRQMKLLKEYYLTNPQLTPCRLFQIPFRRCINSVTQFHPCTLDERTVIDCKSGINYPCVFFLPSVCGAKKSAELLKIDMTKESNLVDDKCGKCCFLNICKTCYASNYIQRGKTSSRDEAICKLQQVCFAISAEYMIEKYIKGSIDIGTGKDAINIYQDMKAIKELYPQLDEIRSNFE